MKTIKNYLPKVRATKYTFVNLQDHKKDFQNLYNYLKKHKDKKVGVLVPKLFNDYITISDIEYLRKYNAMQFLSRNIIFN